MAAPAPKVSMKKAVVGAQEPQAKKKAKTANVAKEAMLAKLQALAGETQQGDGAEEESDESGKES